MRSKDASGKYFLRPGSDDSLTLSHFTDFLVKKIKTELFPELEASLKKVRTLGHPNT